MAMVKYTQHQRRRVTSGSDVKVWAKTEDTRGTFKSPAATDLIKVNETVAIAQLAERVAEAGLASGDRDPAGTFLGRFDHFELPLTVHPRPPLALSGTSVPQEHTLWLRAMGSVKYTNSQLAEDITAVVSHSRSATVIQVADTLTDWSTRPQVVRYISNNADTLDNQAALYEVTAASEPSSGTLNLTITPGLPHYPITSGTADQIQGVTVYYSDDSVPVSDTGVSLLVKRGLQTFAAAGGLVAGFDCTRDARGLLSVTFPYHGEQIAWRGAEDMVFGNGSGDSLNTTELTVGCGNAKRHTADALFTLVKYLVSDGSTLGTEGATTPLKISSVNTSNNTVLFLNRGDSPVSSSNLQAETLFDSVTPANAQERAGTYNVATKRWLSLSFSGREFIPVDLLLPTAPSNAAAATAAELVANINYWFKVSKYYGQFHEGHGGRSISWESVATVAADRVHLVDPTVGSESRIQNEAYSVSTTSAHDVVFQGAFDKRAEHEIQMIPWNPGGTVTLDPIHGKFGMPTIDGHQLKGSSYQCNMSQDPQWIENVVNLTGYPDGAVDGARRTLTAQIVTPAFGWTDELDALAEADSEHYVGYHVGKAFGGTISFLFGAAKIGVPQPGGDNIAEKTVEIAPASPTGSKALIVAAG